MSTLKRPSYPPPTRTPAESRRPPPSDGDDGSAPHLPGRGAPANDLTPPRAPGQERSAVLVIEDNPGDAALVAALLDELDPTYVVTRAPRLATALELVETERFALILADLSLPDSKGVATVTRLLSACAQSTPVIVLTGHADENVASQAVKVGAQDYLIKADLDPDMLRRSIRHAVAGVGHRRHDPVQQPFGGGHAAEQPGCPPRPAILRRGDRGR